MTAYETEAILLAWHVSDGPQGHWVKFKLPLAITDGHPFALFVKGPEHGQRFRMTFEAIGNDELPTGQASVGSAPPAADAEKSSSSAPISPLHKAIEHLYQDGGSTAERARQKTPQAQPRGAAEVATKPKRDWDTIPPSQQAGIACQREDFNRWIREHSPLERWDGESVHTRALAANTDAANEIRWYCGVSSRSELDTNEEAAKRWRQLYSMFTADTTYGEVRR